MWALAPVAINLSEPGPVNAQENFKPASSTLNVGANTQEVLQSLDSRSIPKNILQKMIKFEESSAASNGKRRLREFLTELRLQSSNEYENLLAIFPSLKHLMDNSLYEKFLTNNCTHDFYKFCGARSDL